MNCAVHTQTPAAAYCRTCGKALCDACKRDVMGAIYCEPCIVARLQGGAPAVAAVPLAPDAPSPGLAAFLGFIPGVGAWYNGQFVKGFIHVLIFAMLIVAVSTVNVTALQVIFGLMIGFFPIYMAFDAYAVAKARLMGQPLPDPLGLERLFGIQEAQPPVAPKAANFAVPAAPGAGSPPTSPVQQQFVAQDSPPVGAIVLIALGVLFLLDNLFGMLHFHRLWPLILIGIGLWIAYKRTSVRGRI